MPASTAEASQRLSAWLLLGSAALLSGLMFAHLDALRGMVQLWSNSPMYSYAVTVPFISGYLIWHRRDQLAALRPEASWLIAAPVLAAGILMLLAGRAGGIQVLQQLAFLVSLLGVTLALFGRAYVRAVWPALAYLLLMVPLWDGVTEPLHAPFQDFSAALGTALVRILGVPAYREDVFISLPNLTIEVARACSGVNYLVAVIALGLPLAYVYLRTTWRRLVLLGGAITVAALSNAARVALICVLAYYEIGSPLHGPFHVLHGLFVAGIGYVALFAGLRLLAVGEPASAPGRTARSLANPFGRLSLGAFTALALVFWALAAVPAASESDPIALRSRLDTLLPLRLGGWLGEPASVPVSRVQCWPGADDRIARVYTDAQGRSQEVFVAYFAWQRQGRELASASAEALHRAAEPVQIRGSRGTVFPANRVPLDQSSGRAAIFWYEIDGTTVAARHAVIGRTAWNALVHGRSNGAVVMISGAPAPTLDRAGTDAAAEELAAAVQEALGALLPARTPSVENR